MRPWARGCVSAAGGDGGKVAGEIAGDSVLLHCPTGHLSTVVAGIACGLLPLAVPPPPGRLNEFFRKQLVRRQFGRINVVARDETREPSWPASGAGLAGVLGPPRVLCLSRGGTGPLTETALRQVARVAGCSSKLWLQPAVRAASGKPGDGQSPLPARETPNRGLAAATLVSRACAHLGLHSAADRIMAGAAARAWPDLCARARALPGPGLEQGSGGPAHKASQHQPGRVLYHCFGATHSSVVGASIHCGILRRTGRIGMEEVLGVPSFDRRASADIGHAFFIGTDERGCEAFAIGFNGARGVLTRAALDLLEVMGPGPRRVLLADTLSSVHPLVRLGGYLSRRWHLVAIGRRLAAYGIVASAHRLQGVVADARAAVCDQGRRAAETSLARAGCGDGGDGR